MSKGILLKCLYAILVFLLISSTAFSSSTLDVYDGYYEGIYSFIDMLYYRELGRDTVLGASLNGAFEGMSEYSCFVAAYEFPETNQPGIGAALEKVRSGFVVVSTRPDSPAFKSGLKAGDIIRRVDKNNAAVMSEGYFIQYMADNESALLEVIDGETGEIAIIRINSGNGLGSEVDFAHLGEAGYIRINDFTAETSDKVANALAFFSSVGTYDVILDLRDLVSMDIPEACETAAHLSSGGTLARVGSGTFNSPRKPVPYDVAILVNENTAGAGEVIAHAVEGTVYGETTAGKAVHAVTYPVFTKEAFSKYSREAGTSDIKGIVNYLDARKIEIPDSYVSGYLNIVESGVFSASGRPITENNRIIPDVHVEDTSIGYMDMKPGGLVIDVVRDYSTGSVNYDVYIAKRILSGIGYYDGSFNVTFGHDFAAAVKSYKTDIGFSPNGILDKATQEVMNTYAMSSEIIDDDCVKAALEGFDD